MAKTLILLSLNPQHWPLEEYGYRRRFPKDPVQAYIYLTSPRMEISGFVDFGKPIIGPPQELADRIAPHKRQEMLDYFGAKPQGFLSPIIFSETFDPIPLRTLREHVNVNFQPHPSYLVLDNHPELWDFIQAWHRGGAR